MRSFLRFVLDAIYWTKFNETLMLCCAVYQIEFNDILMLRGELAVAGNN